MVHIITSRTYSAGWHRLECSCGHQLRATSYEGSDIAYGRHILTVVQEDRAADKRHSA